MALRAIIIDMSEAIISRGSSVGESGGVPIGCIVMWGGNVDDIPSDWALCDGSNGTPDLRDRFIVGAGSTYAVGDTGGSDTVQLTIAQMPSHSHSFIASKLTVSESGEHSHTFTAAVNKSWAGTNASMYTESGTGTTSKAGKHTHTISGTGSIGSAGSGTAHENRPPYYALCFIMYIG